MTTTAPDDEAARLTFDPALAVTVRRFAGGSDFGPMAELMGQANLHDGIPWLPTEDNVRAGIEGGAGLDTASDIVLVEDEDGLVAFAMVERKVRDGIPGYDASGYVRPAMRRRGIGGTLLDRNLARMRVRAAEEDPDGGVVVRAFAEEHEIGHLALLSERGFAPVRHYFLMRRKGLGDLPEPALPAGIEIRPVRASEHRRIWEAEVEAFQDHWGAHPPSEHDFEVVFSQLALDTALWVVAWDGDEVAGVVQGWIWAEENERLGLRRGWLERISVRRPWRKRGLGEALTVAAMARLRDAGMTEATLGVDAQNPTGALGLYERLGFQVFERSAAYQRPLDDAVVGG